jgi:hypothetical protein
LLSEGAWAEAAAEPAAVEALAQSYASESDADTENTAAPQKAAQIESQEGGHAFRWLVNAKVLKSRDKATVSPGFELAGVPGSFRLMLKPEEGSERSRRHGACFRSAKGKGIVCLKHEASAGVPIKFKASIGDGEGGTATSPSVVMVHDFSQQSVCQISFPGSKGVSWDFNHALDPSTQSVGFFTVSIEVLPEVEESVGEDCEVAQ